MPLRPPLKPLTDYADSLRLHALGVRQTETALLEPPKEVVYNPLQPNPLAPPRNKAGLPLLPDPTFRM